LLRCVYRERAAISLFDALGGPELLFSNDTIRLVSQTLARFRAIAVDDYGVPASQVMVFATEAMRKAQNAVAMLEAIRVASPGLSVFILAPAVETLLGAVGARSGFVDVKGLFLDLGGGSVQMTYLDSYAAKSAPRTDGVAPEVAAALAGQSMPYGAARLIKVLGSDDAKAQGAHPSQIRSAMNESFKALCARYPSLEAEAKDKDKHKDSRGVDIYLCGGGFRGYGSMLKHSHPIDPYPIPSIGAFTVPGRLFRRTKDMLQLNKSIDGKVFGMSKRRRAQFPAIVAVVDALIDVVPHIRSVTFCSGGNREGALMMMLPPPVRETDPLCILGDIIRPGPSLSADVSSAILPEVVDALRSAFPADLDLTATTSVFGLQLGELYARGIWTRLGDDPDLNASAALHDAVSVPEYPGLTHLARAVLGVTLCARWGANLAPIDQQLHKNLRSLMDAVDPDATFWADYTGAVTAALTTLVKAWPKAPGTVQKRIRYGCSAELDVVRHIAHSIHRFQATAEHGKKFKLHLDIFVAKEAAMGIDINGLVDLFKAVKKEKHEGKKVTVVVNLMQ
jgi:retrograde regulation protein 2